MSIPLVLSIGGFDPTGGAGVLADIKAIANRGCYGVGVITGVVVQSFSTVCGVYPLNPNLVENQLDTLLNSLKIDVIKTGALLSSKIISVITKKLKANYKIVVDPVLRATAGGELLDSVGIEALKTELLPISFLITPNIYEAELLSGSKIQNFDDIKKAAVKLHKLGVKNVLIKGGHFHYSTKSVDILFDGKEFVEFVGEKIIPTITIHGTGCSFSSVVSSEIAKGKGVKEAIREAKEYIEKALLSSIPIQNEGYGTVQHLIDLIEDGQRYHVITELNKALKLIKSYMAPELIPEVRSNLGYALPTARTKMDVAAIPGRITTINNSIVAVGYPQFGASTHIANIILTAMRYDQSKRSAMNIRYNEKIIEVCSKAGLSIAEFSRTTEPKELKEKEGETLAWGIKYVIEKLGYIPDIIYDRGDIGKEPMIRVIGRDPIEVTNKVITISKLLK